MRRFYFEPTSPPGDRVLLSEEESRHIAKVLRLKPGAAIELFDGQGAIYRAIVTAVGRRVEALIEQVVEVVAAPATIGAALWVWQGILKGEKMDTVVQKCTELGVTGMIPFQSERCQGRLDPVQGRKKHQRWQRIGMAACKQCRRLQAMQLDEPACYRESLGKRPDDTSMVRLLFWEEEKEVHLHDIAALDQARSLGLMLGPEGGFSPEEVAQARQAGWRTVGLGERILRAETATLSAVAIVQYLAGNL